MEATLDKVKSFLKDKWMWLLGAWVALGMLRIIPAKYSLIGGQTFGGRIIRRSRRRRRNRRYRAAGVRFGRRLRRGYSRLRGRVRRRLKF